MDVQYVGGAPGFACAKDPLSMYQRSWIARVSRRTASVAGRAAPDRARC